MFSFVTPGAILAPTIGGAIYSRAGYVAVFLVGGGVLVVDFIMRLFLIEKPVARRYMQIEDEAVEDSAANESTDTNGHAEAGPTEDSPLLKVDDKIVYKIPPGQPERVRNFPFLYCLSDVSLAASMFIALVHAILIGSFDATLPKYGEELFGFDSLQAGLLFIPLGVIDSLITPFTGWLVDRFGAKRVGTPGFVLTAPLMFAFRFVTSNTHEQLVLYCVLLAFAGIGLSVIGTPSLVEAGGVVQRYYDANPAFFDHHPPYATLYGLQSMVFMLGLTIGPLVAGGLKDWIGYGNMNAGMAVISIVSAVVCWQFLGRRPKPKPMLGGEEEG
jgi:MFS family permease